MIPLVIKSILDKAEEESEAPTDPEDRLFANNLPNKSWVHRFVQRNPQLSARTPEHLGHMRRRVSERSLRDWFNGFKLFLKEEHGLEAEDFLTEENSHRVFNLDESGFPLCGTNKLKIVTERGCKNVYNVATESKE